MIEATLDALQDLRDVLESEIGAGRQLTDDGQLSDRRQLDEVMACVLEYLRSV